MNFAISLVNLNKPDVLFRFIIDQLNSCKLVHIYVITPITQMKDTWYPGA